jgi:hypothetical protein
MKYLKRYKLFENYSRWGSKELKESEFNSLFSENCKNYSGENTKIFRGIDYIGDFVFIDPKKGEIRSSIEDTNIHIDLIDDLPSWKDYPKYSKCVIGITGEKDSASNYGGTIYEIIPYDNSKIAVCPEPTIWEAFSDGGWGDYIYLVDRFFYEFGIDNVNQLKSIGNITTNSSYPGELSDATEFLENLSRKMKIKFEDITGLDCFNFINDYLFNPDERGFELLNYTKGFEANNYKQVWTDGPVLMKKIVRKY